MSFTEIRKAGFDTETTGTDPEEARIVTAALVVRGGGKPDHDSTWLINPGVSIPAEATAIHGIDDAKAQAEGANPKVALEEIAAKLAAALNFGMPVVAFNLSYDWTVLDRELRRHGLATMDERLNNTHPPLIDPHVIDKQVIPRRKGSGQRKLQPTAEVYGVTLTDWHTADADALAALLIADAQFARFPQLAALNPAELFAAQVEWRAEQQASLQEWFRTTAPPEKGGDPNKEIDGSWPLRPFEPENPDVQAVDVLTLLARGDDFPAIGRRLGIGVRTARRLLAEAMDEYRATNETHTVALAIGRGAIPADVATNLTAS